MRKAALRALLAVIALYVAYVVGINLLLSTPSLRGMLNRNEGKLYVQYERAASWWPGRVHAEGLLIRASDNALEWQLKADEVDFTVSLLDLAKKRFHTTRLDGDGITFRMRLKLSPEDATPDRVSRIPTIAGFGDVPFKNPGPKPEPPSDANYHLWTVELDGIHATSVRELWLDTFRLAGDMRTDGGFYLRPLRRFELFPTSVELTNTEIRTGGDVILTDLKGRVDARVEGFDVRETQHGDILRFVSAYLPITAATGDLRFLRHFFPPGDDVELSGGHGKLRSDIRVQHGVVTANSTLDVDLEPVSVAVGERRVQAALRMRLSAGEDDAGQWANLGTTLTGFSFFDTDAKTETLAANTMVASAHVPGTDLARLPSEISYAFDVPRLLAPDLHAVDAYLAKQNVFRVSGGRGEMTVRGHGNQAGLESAVMFAADDARLRLQGADFSAKLASNMNGKIVFASRMLNLSASTVDLKDVNVVGGPRDGAWWAHLEAKDGHVHLSPLSGRFGLAAECPDARPLTWIYDKTPDASGFMKAMLSIAPDSLIRSATRGVRATAEVLFAPRSLDVHALEMRSQSLEIRGELNERGDSKRGAFLVRSGALAAELEIKDESTSVRLVGAEEAYRQAYGNPPPPPAVDAVARRPSPGEVPASRER